MESSIVEQFDTSSIENILINNGYKVDIVIGFLTFFALVALLYFIYKFFKNFF